VPELAGNMENGIPMFLLRDRSLGRNLEEIVGIAQHNENYLLEDRKCCCVSVLSLYSVKHEHSANLLP